MNSACLTTLQNCIEKPTGGERATKRKLTWSDECIVFVLKTHRVAIPTVRKADRTKGVFRTCDVHGVFACNSGCA